MRGALVILALALVLGSPMHGQGVPTQDNAGVGQLVALLSRLGEDAETQDTKRATGTSLAGVQADQLRVLEAMSAALTGPGLDIRALEGNADFPASEVYPVVSDHPMDSRLFGEGRETIEMMIVRVASEYADAPGVSDIPAPKQTTVVKDEWDKTGRNAPCPCGSGRKFKHCHG